MKLILSFFSFLFLINTTVYAQVAENTKIDLHLNLQAGERYLYATSVNQKITQDVMGTAIEMNQSMEFDYEYLIESSEEGVMKIAASYTKIKFDVNSPQGGALTVDSENEDGDSQLSSTVSQLIGKPFYIYLTSTGEVKKVEGYKELIAGIDNEQFARLFTDSSLNNLLSMDIYADSAVAVGDSWDKFKSIPIHDIKLGNKITYTLEGTSEDIAWINVAGTVYVEKGDSGLEAEIEGTQNGTIEIDLKNGLLHTGTITSEMNGVLRSQGYEVPVTIYSEATISAEKR